MAIGNSVNDEIKEQHKKVLEQEGFKGRLTYFFYYYKMHALVVIALTIFVTAFIVQIVTRKDTLLQVIFVNAFPTQESETFMEDFGQKLGINEKKEEVLLDDSFYISNENPSRFDEQNEEKIFVMAAAGTIDVCVADEFYFKKLAEQGFLLDLSTILPEDKMEEYQDRLFYYNSPNNMSDIDEAVGLNISDAPKIISTKCYPNTDCYFCVIVNSKHPDNAIKFLDYLEGDLVASK